MKGKFKVKVNGRGNVFWGILFLLGAAAFLVSKLGILEGIGFWSILFTIGLTGIFISGLVKRRFGQMLFSLAFLVIVNDEFLKLEALTPWPVLGAALLGTIGLNLLFPKFGRNKSGKLIAGGEHRVGDTVSEDGVFYENVFGSAVKYVVGEISQVRVDNAFGPMEVYFTDVVLKEHSARVNIDSSFGKVTLYVPRDWRVVNEVTLAFANGNYSDYENDSQGENTLYISGNIAFGQLLIQAV
ncbi:MAG: cell wall-active antibiotics response protein [Lachnospiraceae bacterium]|nr:cell wall-active antibiotics response protein [Lachnospiraceae bacterium]